MTLDERDAALRRRVLAALEDPAAWPAEAAALYHRHVRWHCPARRLVLHGRDAVLARVRADAGHLAAARPVTLRQAIAGERVIHEFAAALQVPAGGIEGVPLAPGTRVELGCTRILLVQQGHVVEERALETWTALAR
jgi:hypothetical protein